MSILELDELGTLQRTVAPTLLPVTLEEIKDELEIVDDDTINTRITRLANRIVSKVEIDSRRAIMTQTWKLVMDRFPSGEIELRRGPVASLTHIKYYADGVQETLATSGYQTDLISTPARIWRAIGASWPTVDSGQINAVELQWVAGYATQSAVPDELKDIVLAAIKMDYYGCGFGDNYWAMILRIRQYGYV